jgi:hypothetical protein
MSITKHRRKRHRVSTRMRQGNRRNHRRYSLARLLIIAGIAILAASVMVRRILRPLRRPPYSRISRIALPAQFWPSRRPPSVSHFVGGRSDVRAAEASVKLNGLNLFEMVHSERAELSQSLTLAVGRVLNQNPLPEVRSCYGRTKFRSIREHAV